MRAVKKAVQTTKLLDKEEELDKKLRGAKGEDTAAAPEEPAAPAASAESAEESQAAQAHA